MAGDAAGRACDDTGTAATGDRVAGAAIACAAPEAIAGTAPVPLLRGRLSGSGAGAIGVWMAGAGLAGAAAGTGAVAVGRGGGAGMDGATII
jgi:hypothetical protein